jgi:hypothetical protein
MSQHVGWFGHGNLGDDEMLRILEEHLPDTETFGGGTLITPGFKKDSEFYSKITDPDNTVGISLGVSSDWNGEGAELLIRLKAIYARDLYSHVRLRAFNIDSIVSVDLWNVHVAPKRKRFRKVANLIDLSHKEDKYLSLLPHFIAERRNGFEFFQMSQTHNFMGGAQAFSDGKKLIEYLSEAEVAVTTRLHATVAAWIAGVPDIRPVIYDQKCAHFLDRAASIDQPEAHEMIMRHLEEIRNL